MEDFAVGMPFLHERAGAIRVFSSKSNAPLFDLPGSGTNYFGADLSELGDIDGDGVDDVAATRYDSGSWETIVSMKSRRELFSVFAGAEEILVCRDLNGDGTRDLLLTRKWSDQRDSKTQAVSGKTGENIELRLPAAIDDMIPVRTRTTKDGLRTLGLVFKPEGEVEFYDCIASLDQPIQRGHYLKSEIARLSKLRLRSNEGALWSADFDGDGVFDLVELRFFDRIASAREWRLALNVLGSRKGGVLFEREWSADASPPQCLANCIGLPGDLNADSIPDLIVGVPFAWATPGGVFAISGSDGSSIWRIAPLREAGPSGSSTLDSTVEIGVSLGILGDLDGDKVDDLVVGCGDYHWGAGTEKVGVVLTLSGRTGNEIRRILETDQPDTLK